MKKRLCAYCHGSDELCSHCNDWGVEEYDPDFDEFCPVGKKAGETGPHGVVDPEPNMHCECWYDDGKCCRCGANELVAEANEHI